MLMSRLLSSPGWTITSTGTSTLSLEWVGPALAAKTEIPADPGIQFLKESITICFAQISYFGLQSVVHSSFWSNSNAYTNTLNQNTPKDSSRDLE